MQTNGFGILQIPEWIIKFAYINVLWVCFSLLGIIIFGLFPATTAMFAVVRKWLLGEGDLPIFKTFWTFYKKDFLKSNFLGLVLFLIGVALYIYYQLFQQTAGNHLEWIHYLLLAVTFLYAMTLSYAFPVFVHYEITVFQVIKTSFLTMIVSPMSTIMMVAGGIIVYLAMTTFPGLIPIFGGSLVSFLLMWSTHLSFSNIEQKKKRLSSNSNSGVY